MKKIIVAIRFSTHAHLEQKRKGKDVPYITHPLSVGIILAKAGAAENVVIAGILHDTLEDTTVTYDQIVESFGKEVADMVNNVTEQDTSLPWTERKRLALDHVAHMNRDSVFVKSADVLHNLTEQIEDYKEEGEKMFRRFNAPKQLQLERYTKLVDALEKKWPGNPLLLDLKSQLHVVTSLWSK